MILECNACRMGPCIRNVPCMFGRVDREGNELKPSWREVKEEPAAEKQDIHTAQYGGAAGEEKPKPSSEANGVVTWTSAPHGDEPYQFFVHVECPGCEHKDRQIEKLKTELATALTKFEAYEIAVANAVETQDKLDQILARLDQWRPTRGKK